MSKARVLFGLVYYISSLKVSRPVLLSLEPGQEVKMTHDQKSWTCSVMKKIQRFIRESRLYYLICHCAFNPRWTHVNQMSLCLLESSLWWKNVTCPHSHTKSQESKVCSILLIIQRTAESLLLQLLTTCHSRASPRQFGALGEIRIWGPQNCYSIS